MITCWLYQKIISSRVSARLALPDRARRHAQSCPTCRQYYESATALARQLSLGADNERRPPSPFLHGKIMSAIRAEENLNPQPARARLNWAIPVTAACLFLLAGIVWLLQPAAPSQNLSSSAAVPADQALNVTLPSAAQVGRWTKTLDAPLENETQLVLNDAKTVIHSLANSFLPDNFQASLLENAPR
jgi:hypothetical protein